MKFICEGLDLSDAVLRVIRATATKTTNPILEGIKIEAKEDTLILTATNLEISIEKIIPADVKISGEIVVPGKVFAEFVKKLSNEQIEFTLTEENKLKIKYGDSEGSLQCLRVDEFPRVNKVQTDKMLNVNKTELKRVIDRTMFCAAIDDARPILKGCLFEIENNTLTSIALDGFKLALYKIKIDNNTNNLKCIIPATSLNEISKLLITANKEEKVNVSISDKYIMVEDGNTTIISRLLEGEFINYKQVIPTSFNTSFIANKEQLESGIQRASLLSKQDKNSLIKLEINENLLTLSSASSIGKIKENLNISLEGKNLVIAFNSKFLSDCVGNVAEEIVKVNFVSPFAPCTITSPENDNFLYLILPVRIVE